MAKPQEELEQRHADEAALRAVPLEGLPLESLSQAPEAEVLPFEARPDIEPARPSYTAGKKIAAWVVAGLTTLGVGVGIGSKLSGGDKDPADVETAARPAAEPRLAFPVAPPVETDSKIPESITQTAARLRESNFLGGDAMDNYIRREYFARVTSAPSMVLKEIAIIGINKTATLENPTVVKIRQAAPHDYVADFSYDGSPLAENEQIVFVAPIEGTNELAINHPSGALGFVRTAAAFDIGMATANLQNGQLFYGNAKTVSHSFPRGQSELVAQFERGEDVVTLEEILTDLMTQRS